jgi:tetratricopeptide (TPR) repeat protein
VGNRHGEVNVLLGLGELERVLSRSDQARAAYEEARTFYKQEGDRLGEAYVLRGLGELERQLGRSAQARATYEEAARLFGSLGMMAFRDEALRAAGLPE